MLFYLIAGEPSGDIIGASLMRALTERTQGIARFAGIGGEAMAALGLESRVPLNELAIMGFLELIPAARRLLRRVRETAEDIERQQPVAVVTIDSSGFCFRVGEALRKSGKTPPPIIHYVAPMVWALREHRARSAKRAADHLLTLFPFEPPYFEQVGLPATYVGHPVVEGEAGRGDGAGFRRRHGIDAAAPVLCVLPGSRMAEVRRLLPVFGRTVERMAARFPNLVVVVPTVANVADAVAAAVEAWAGKSVIVRGVAEKFDAFAASNAALAASGTVALELAMARVPMVVGYRLWSPTYWAVRRVVKVRFANLINLLLDRLVVPELLQEACTPGRLEAALLPLLTDEKARRVQLDAFDAALRQIGLGGAAPSRKAADIVLAQVAARISNTPR
jgi:lipid-A-disaccharide synthase